MKRFWSAILCVAMLLVMLPVISQRASAAPVSSVDVQLTEPVASYTPNFSPVSSDSSVSVYNTVWKENSAGFSATLNSSSEFKAGLAYKVEIWLRAYASTCFAMDIYHELSATFTVNGKTPSSVSVKGRDGDGLITDVLVTYEYGPLSGMEVSDVMIKGIPEPLAGQMPIYSFTMANTNSCSFYPTEPISWVDKTTGKTMDSGDTFVEGHIYTLSIWVCANRYKGFTFRLDDRGEPDVDVVLNSFAPTSVSTAYEQEPREVIDIYHQFAPCKAPHTCAPQLVKKQEPTCLMPGFKAYYACSCGKNYEDAAGKKEITDMDGYGILAALGHKEGTWSYNGTHHYKKCTTCKEVIPGTNAAHSGGTASCVKKAVCTVCAQAYGSLSSEHRWGTGWEYKNEKGHAKVCADCGTNDALKSHTPGAAATESSPQTCKDCGYVIAPAKDHTHKLTKVKKVAATCTKDGTIEHYVCSGCSALFSDSAGKKKLSSEKDLVISKLGHTESKKWGFNDEEHWKLCATCQEPMTQTQMKHDLKADKCTLCGYSAKTTTTTEPEATTPTTAPAGTTPAATVPGTSAATTGTEPTGQTELETGPAATEDKAEDGVNWLVAVLVGLVFFAAGVTVTVIILKKKTGRANVKGE